MFGDEIFREDYDILPDVLESLPADCNEEEFGLWILKMTTEKNVQLQIVEENLNKSISNNSSRFVEGIETINAFDVDVHSAKISLTNSRRLIKSAKEQMIYPAYKIVHMKRRKMRKLLLLKRMNDIIELFNMEESLERTIQENSLNDAVKLGVKLQSTIDDPDLERIDMIDSLLNRIKLTMTKLTEVLRNSLSDVILNFSIDNYEGIISSYLSLNKRSQNGKNADIVKIPTNIKTYY